LEFHPAYRLICGIAELLYPPRYPHDSLVPTIAVPHDSITDARIVGGYLAPLPSYRAVDTLEQGNIRGSVHAQDVIVALVAMVETETASTVPPDHVIRRQEQVSSVAALANEAARSP
jgi:hypothetical protein